MRKSSAYVGDLGRTSGNDAQYGGWYRPDEQERRQRLRLLEQEREAEDERAWGAYLAEITKLGKLGTVERLLKEMRSHSIMLARTRGKSLKEAKIDGELLLANMKKLLSNL